MQFRKPKIIREADSLLRESARALKKEEKIEALLDLAVKLMGKLSIIDGLILEVTQLKNGWEIIKEQVGNMHSQVKLVLAATRHIHDTRFIERLRPRIEEIIAEARDTKQKIAQFRVNNGKEEDLIRYGERIFQACEDINKKIARLSGEVEESEVQVESDIEQMMQDLQDSLPQN